MYKNGALVGPFNPNGGTYQNKTDIFLSASPELLPPISWNKNYVASAFFSGTVAYLRIFNNATLAAADVTIRYNSRFQCKANFYGSNDGSCEPCAANTTSPPGATSCSSIAPKSCLPGSYRTVGFTPTAGVSCAPCAAGTYSATTDASSCSDCAAGSYSAVASKACLSCPAGSFAASAGQSSCTPCPAGTASTTTGATVTSTCAACPSGIVKSMNSVIYRIPSLRANRP